MSKIKSYILNQVANKVISQEEAKSLLVELKQQDAVNVQDEIAIIGISARFPRANNVSQFWSNLLQGKNCITDLPEEREENTRYYFDNIYARMYSTDEFYASGNNELEFEKHGYLTEIDTFDAAFFGISPREARAIDPVQRIFLETCYESFEDAGYGGKKITGTNTGVFVGRNHTKSSNYDKMVEGESLSVTGTWTGILSSRVSYLFNLKGPSIVIDTACSAGLVAVHEACKSLKNGECEMAIAGGTSGILYVPVKGLDKSLVNYESNDEQVRTFDNNANGTVWSEGIGTVLLKPLHKAIEDNDNIYAVIKGSAINNDGYSNGLTAPNALAQEEVLVKAWENAKINPEDLQYIEAHGTGTVLGDPIEIKALTNAFKRYTDKRQFCGIGSVKSNMGHLVGASGLAGLLKVVMSLKNKQIPASINFQHPNEFINFTDSPLYITDTLKEWEHRGNKRLAGISSFGFSGTNCHVVVGEAGPASLQKTESETKMEDAQGPFILTVSAKNEYSLDRLLKSYKDFLETNPEQSAKEICYGSNTGRGHYSIRMALLVNDSRDMLNKITSLLKGNYRECYEDWFFYGESKIVSNNKKNRESGEITENDRKMINSEAAALLDEMLKLPKRSIGKMSIFCNYYIKGAEIDWEKLYGPESIKKISLPVYPFNRERFWPELDTCTLLAPDERTPGAGEAHPLVDVFSVESAEGDIFVTWFEVDKHWVLKDHRVLGRCTLPGTTFIEMAKYISEKYYKSDSVELRDIIFYTPVVVDDDEKKEVQMIVKHEDDFLHFSIVSRDDSIMGNGWVKHSEGKIVRLENNERKIFDMHPVLERCQEQSATPIEVYDGEHFTFGKRWQIITREFVGENEFALDLELPDDIKGDVAAYHMHPALLDKAANCFSQDIAEGMYLPLMYKKMKVYHNMPSAFNVYVKLKSNIEIQTETLTFDIVLVDKEGAIISEIEDYNIKRVNVKELQNKVSKNTIQFYNTQWIRTGEPSVQGSLAEGAVLFFNNQSSISNALLEHIRSVNSEVVEVRAADQYEKQDGNLFTVSNSSESYNSLFADLKEKNITRIVHMFTTGIASQGESYDSFVKAKERSLYSLFNITKSLIHNKYKQHIDVAIIADYVFNVTGEQCTINPVANALAGLGKVVSMECHNLSCRVIDIDDPVSTGLLSNELIAENDSFNIAYREGVRYKDELQVMDGIQYSIEPETRLTEHGVYVITGGTGGLALETARNFAASQSVKICLLSRSQLPERGQWDSLDNAGSKVRSVIETIKEIENNGSEAEYYSVDITRESEVVAVLDSIRSRFGKINGIIHCAGVAGDGFIMNKDRDTFDSVVMPKMDGVWLLDSATRNDDLEMFVLFSSITSLFAGMGQGDYTAGNAFMDAFSIYRKQKGQSGLAINWAPWKEAGMAVEYGVQDGDKSSLLGITNNEAFAILHTALGHDGTPLMAGTLNYKVIQDRGTLLNFSEAIEDEFKKFTNKEQKAKTGPAADREDVSVIIGDEGEDHNAVEKRLAQIWARALGLTEISIYDNYSSLGGDSIIAIELLKDLEKEFPGLIDVTDIYSYPSVSQMAEYINQQLESTPDDKNDQRTANADETTSDEVLSNLTVDEDESGEVLLNSGQAWYLSVMNKRLDPDWWNIGTVLNLDLAIDSSVFRESLQFVSAYHTTLRARFKQENGQWKQEMVRPEDDTVNLKTISMAGHQVDNYYTVFEKEIAGIQKEFKIQGGPLYYVLLFNDCADGKDYIAIITHHLLMDMYSMIVLVTDLITVYMQAKDGGQRSLPPKTYPLKKWNRDIVDYTNNTALKEELSYWKSLPWDQVGYLPRDFKDGRNIMASFTSVEASLERDETGVLLKDVTAKYKVQMLNVLLAALVKTVSDWYGKDWVEVLVTLSGRDALKDKRYDLSRTLGWFACSGYYVLKNETHMADGVESIKRQLSRIPNQVYGLNFMRFISSRVEELQEYFDPKFKSEILFNYTGTIEQGFRDGDESSSIREVNDMDIQFENPEEVNFSALLDVAAKIQNDRLVVKWNYSRNIFKEETIAVLAENYMNNLKTLIDNVQEEIACLAGTSS